MFNPYQIWNGRDPPGRNGPYYGRPGRGLPVYQTELQDAWLFFLQQLSMSVQSIVPGYGVSVDSNITTAPIVGLNVLGDGALYDVLYLNTAYTNANTAGSLGTDSGLKYNPTTSTLSVPTANLSSISASTLTLQGSSFVQGTVYTDTISTLSGVNITFVAPVYLTLANISTGNISTFGTSYVNAIGTIANPGTVSTTNASISTLTARTGTISTFTSAYVNAIGTVGVGGSISTANASISSLNCLNGTTAIGTVSSLTSAYVNANGTAGVGGSISTANASISTLGVRTGTISTFTASYVNAIGTVGVGGSISTANASISTLGVRTGTISTFTTSYVNAIGGAISTTQATISSLNVSSINGAPAQPKYYYVNSNAVVGTVNPSVAPSYNITFLTQNIPTVSGQKYQLIASANVNSIVGTNDTLFTQLFVNGTATTLSTAVTNSGINHNQQVFLTYQGTYNFTSGATSHALGIATSGTATNYSIPQAQFTIITPIP